MQFTPETWQFIREHQHEDVRSLALQSKRTPHLDIPSAIVQIAGRQAAEHKIPSWYAVDKIIYPMHLSLEQCSSEVTARYKSTLLQGETLVDLTGGFGIDCAFLAPMFRQVTYIERQKELCDIASHNFELLGLKHIGVTHADSVTALNNLAPVDCIFIDPARRNEHGGKTVQLSDCEPNVQELEQLLLTKAKRVMVKLSPMLDLSLALRGLPHTTEAHIVSVQNECKELLLILENREVIGEVPIHCINFTRNVTQKFTFTREEENRSQVVYTHEPEAYLYEPNASILKGGAFRSMASACSLKKLHPNSHLYTSDTYIETFPGRSFRIKEVSTLKDKKFLHTIAQANIAVRNFPLSVAELRKRTKLKDGGETYLFATTLNNEKKVLIRCEKA